MKRLLVLGAGTAGTMAVNKLRPLLPREEWNITVVDSDDTHYYQPGYLFVPFGIYRPDEIVKPKKRFIPSARSAVLRLPSTLQWRPPPGRAEEGCVGHRQPTVRPVASRTIGCRSV